MENYFTAWDSNTYSRTPEYPNAFSYVNDTGVRYFVERFKCYCPTDPPSGVYPLLPRPRLLQKVAEKSSVGSRTVNIAAGKLMVSHVSFQAYKKHNEDRTFVHDFPHGLLFRVLDGHIGPKLSEFAAKRLPLHPADTFTQAIVDHPTTESVTSAFRTAFATFDKSLSKVFEKFPDKEEGEWEPYKVHGILGPKAKASEPDSLFGAMRRAAVGTTALVGYINRSKRDLWMASLGDSEAFIGRLISDGYKQWSATPLYEVHKLQHHQPRRSQQTHTRASRGGRDKKCWLFECHPGCVFGLYLTRNSFSIAFGDFHCKVNVKFGLDVPGEAYPCPVSPKVLEEWGIEYPTPPYMSCEPSAITRSLKLEEFSLEDQGKFLISLSGVEDNDHLDQWNNKIGHSFIPRCEGDNTAERILHNVLFGEDDRELAREVMMEFPNESKDPRLQDDITVMVVEFPNTDCTGSEPVFLLKNVVRNLSPNLSVTIRR